MTRIIVAAHGQLGDAIERAAAAETGIDIAARIDPDQLTLSVARERPDVVILAGVDAIEEAAPAIRSCLDIGAAVLTTCSELVSPRRREETEAIERYAEQVGRPVVALAAGSSLVIDILPIVLSLPCSELKAIRVNCRIEVGPKFDTSLRGLGVGLARTTLERLISAGVLEHRGAAGQARLLAHALGIPEPESPCVTVRPAAVSFGRVTSVIQEASYPTRAGKPSLTLSMEIMEGPTSSTLSTIAIEGQPTLSFELRSDIPTDITAAALLVAAIGHTVRATAGVTTALDLPPARALNTMAA